MARYSLGSIIVFLSSGKIRSKQTSVTKAMIIGRKSFRECMLLKLVMNEKCGVSYMEIEFIKIDLETVEISGTLLCWLIRRRSTVKRFETISEKLRAPTCEYRERN